jgi:hypothetical protein
MKTLFVSVIFMLILSIGFSNSANAATLDAKNDIVDLPTTLMSDFESSELNSPKDTADLDGQDEIYCFVATYICDTGLGGGYAQICGSTMEEIQQQIQAFDEILC